jgi:hypothetical protein
MGEIACDLLMNLFEVSVWALVLERFVWNGNAYCTVYEIRQIITCAAYAAKSEMSMKLPEFFERLMDFKQPGFMQSYSYWKAGKFDSLQTLNPKLINKKFEELTAPPDESLINYNFYVDDILFACMAPQDEDECQQYRPIPYSREPAAYISTDNSPMQVEEEEEPVYNYDSGYADTHDFMTSVESWSGEAAVKGEFIEIPTL